MPTFSGDQRMRIATRIFGVLALLALGLAVLSVYESSSFQECEAKEGGNDHGQQQEEGSSNFLVPLVRGAILTAKCTGTFVDINEAAITALSTLFIAVFTLTLWLSTARLFRVTNVSAKAAQESAEVAKKSLLAANRPVIAITSLELCEANEFQAAPHINFGLVNSGKGTAIVNKVSVIVSSIYGGIGLATNPPINSWFVPSDVNSEIEPGQPMSGYPITAPFLGAQELQQIKSGGRTLRIIFNITFKDIFKNGYMPTISFDFDHRQKIFITRSSLIPEKEK
jgi:hypothetical protein